MHKYRAFVAGALATTVALVTAVGSGSASAACIPAPANLTQWWLADGTAKDARGDNDAFLQHGATYGAGQVGQAFVLDGVDDFVSVPNDPAVELGTGDFTLNLWVYFNDASPEQVLIEKWVETFDFNTRRGWTFVKIGDNSLRFAMPPSDLNSPPLTIPSLTWIHFAVRRSGDVFTMFMNGAVVASDTFSNIDLTTTSSIKFGYRGSPADTTGSTDTRGFFLNGSIDEVQFFVGHALSDLQIQAIYAAGTDGQCRTCGNSVVDPGEDCDDGNPTNGDGCENDCTSTCGDNVTGPGEECDDGAFVDGDGCDSNCTQTACGNGIVTSPEECDDGGTTAGDGCSSSCAREVNCGDGVVESGEACDDGNYADGDGCSANCGDEAAPESQADAELTAGETLSSDSESDGATPADPIETDIVMSVGTASASIDEVLGAGPTVPGYAFFGQTVQINFDCSVPPCPTASDPLTLAFRIDASRIPAGEDENSIAPFRDGSLVPECTGALGVADPDPCVSARQLFGDGDVGITVLTSLASEWGFAQGICSPTVLTCDTASKSLFKVQKTIGDPDATKLLWKWKGTTSSGYGEPNFSTGYTLCVYDGAALVESHAVVPAGLCDSKPCWKVAGAGSFMYKNRSANSTGITQVKLKSTSGGATILVKGRGASLAVPGTTPIYTQATNLTVQLLSDGGSCWGAVYSNPPKASSETSFKDKAP